MGSDRKKRVKKKRAELEKAIRKCRLKLSRPNHTMEAYRRYHDEQAPRLEAAEKAHKYYNKPLMGDTPDEYTTPDISEDEDYQADGQLAIGATIEVTGTLTTSSSGPFGVAQEPDDDARNNIVLTKMGEFEGMIVQTITSNYKDKAQAYDADALWHTVRYINVDMGSMKGIHWIHREHFNKIRVIERTKFHVGTTVMVKDSFETDAGKMLPTGLGGKIRGKGPREGWLTIEMRDKTRQTETHRIWYPNWRHIRVLSSTEADTHWAQLETRLVIHPGPRDPREEQWAYAWLKRGRA